MRARARVCVRVHVCTRACVCVCACVQEDREKIRALRKQLEESDPEDHLGA